MAVSKQKTKKSAGKPASKPAPKKVAKKPSKVATKAKVPSKKLKKVAKAKAKSAPTKNTKKASPAKVQAPKKAAPKKSVSQVPAKKVASSNKSTGPKGKAWMMPLDDRILVEVPEETQVSKGGIILVETSQQPENIQGYVLAIGRGHQNKKGRIRPIEAKVGDKIIFSKYAGDKVSYDGVNFVIIRETEVLGFASK